MQFAVLYDGQEGDGLGRIRTAGLLRVKEPS